MLQKKFVWFGTGLCMAATAVLLIGESGVRASVPGVHTGLAGISLYIDQYYENIHDFEATAFGADPEEERTVQEAEEEPKEEEVAGQQLEQESEEEQQPEEVKEPVSELENVGVSIANPYVNIRTEPNTDSEIVGKLYKGCAAEILEHVDDWVRISSGNAEGYIKEEFLAIGFDAEELVDKYGTRWAVVVVDGLRVRMEPSVESRIATLVPNGEKLEVISINDEGDWYEISMDDGDITGYVYAEYVNIEVEFEHAVTIEEEQEELRRQQEAEEALRRQEEEQRKREQQAAAQQSSQNHSSSNSSSSGSSNSSNTSNSSSSAGNSSSSNSSSSSADVEEPASSQPASTSSSGLGEQIVSFAKNFLGRPYVYGGTSLTNGTDCSGFVQSVYKSFNITLPRDSRSQCAGAGYQVSLDCVKPGDLIFYTNNSGTVNHVALYIGGGQVIHASDPSSGIKISNMRYRTPYMAKRVVD